MAEHEEEMFSESDIDESGSEEENEEEGNGLKKREPYNDQDLMKVRLEELKKDIAWVERLDITINSKNLPGLETDDDDKDKTQANKGNSMVEDDFQRELQFYRQAQVSAKEALQKLQKLGVTTQRPDDYFAEMVKSDAHMQKIRQKIINKKDSIEKSEKAKKQRTLKKYGKQIQHEVLQKRQQEKKKMLQAVDHLKKNKGKLDKMSGKNDADMFDINPKSGKEKRTSNGNKRKHKDEKFGFGGMKKKIKKNSAESSSNAVSDFKRGVHGKIKSNPGKGKTGAPKRLGKSRRKQNKNKK